MNLWTKESGWNHKSSNGSSGAYGIPQSLPGRKMASHGKDWRTNPETQIRWGLSFPSGSLRVAEQGVGALPFSQLVLSRQLYRA